MLRASRGERSQRAVQQDVQGPPLDSGGGIPRDVWLEDSHAQELLVAATHIVGPQVLHSMPQVPDVDSAWL